MTESAGTGETSEVWLLDLDGVVWLADDPIPGSAQAIAALRRAGRRVAFFTNNSFATRASLIEKFGAHGIDCAPEDLFSSAQAAAQLLDAGQRAFVLGGPGIEEALRERGLSIESEASIGDGAKVDAVVAGLDLGLTFPRLTAATRAVNGGARIVGTNDDATYPTPDGPLPGGGSMLAALTYATGATATVAGKPNATAATLVQRALGQVAVMVGDRPETDGLFAQRLGARYALVRSGVTPPGVVVTDPHPDLDAADLARLVEEVLS